MVGGRRGGAGAGGGLGGGGRGRIGGGMGMGNFSPEGKLAPGTYDSPLHPLRRSSNGTDGSKTSGAGMFLGMGAGFSLGEVSSASARSEDVRSSNFDFQDDTAI